MHLRSTNVGPVKGNVWSDASGEKITGDVLEHYLGGERPISRTSVEEAVSEADRLKLSWMLGLESGGYPLHRLDDTEWPELGGHAGYVFDEPEDGMIDHQGGTYMSFVGFAYPTTSEFPPQLNREDNENDPGVWVLEKVYGMGDEKDCPWCGSGTGNENARKGCLLCEGNGVLYEPYHVVALYQWVETPEEDDDNDE